MSYKLLRPDERVPQDQPNGRADLISTCYAGDGKPAADPSSLDDLLCNLPGDLRLYRGRTVDEADEMSLAALSGLFPAANRQRIEPFPSEALTRALSFSSAAKPLGEEEKGILIPSPFPRDVPAAPSAAAVRQSPGAKKKKEKKEKSEKSEHKHKEKKNKKEKKEKDKKRESGEEPMRRSKRLREQT